MTDSERDPIMAELREIRARMVAKVGNDPGAILEYVERKRSAAATDGGGQAPPRDDASALDERSEE